MSYGACCKGHASYSMHGRLGERNVMKETDLATSRLVSKPSKGYKGLGMEGLIAKWYAKIRKNEIAEIKGYARKVADSNSEGKSILDLAPGPGYLAIELAKLGSYRIVGLDISKTFVEIAQKEAAKAKVEVEFRHGDASSMPFDDETFDFIICTAAFKNFTEPIAALNEMHRVLQRQGTALIIDLRKDISKESIDIAVNEMGLSRINSLLTKWIFRHMLTRRAYTKSAFENLVAKTRFNKCKIEESPLGLEIKLEK